MTDQPSTTENKPKEKFWTADRIKHIGSLALVVVLMAVLIWQRENISAFSITLAHYPVLKFLGVFLISMAASATIIIPLPGLALTSIFGAFATGGWDLFWLGVVSGLGATCGELTGYMLGYSGQMAIHDNPLYEKMVGWMSKWGSLTIFILALIPNPLFDMAGIVAGILKFPVWKFLLVGAAGRIPKHVLFCYLGSKNRTGLFFTSGTIWLSVIQQYYA